MSDTVDPGRLRKRLTLEEPDDTSDGAGGAVREWTTVSQFWGELHPVAMRANTESASAEQQITHELIYRAGPDLTRTRRLRFGARLFNIIATADLTDDGAFKKALVEEIKP